MSSDRTTSGEDDAADTEELAGLEDPDTEDPDTEAQVAEGLDTEESVTEEPGDEESGAAAGEAGPITPKRLVLGATALALAAFIVAAVFGVMWLIASTSDSAELGSARESVRSAGREAVQAFTELDYENPDAYFRRNKEVSTPELAKQIQKSEDTYRKALSDAKTKVTTTVQDIAVQELNAHDGTATFLAVASTDITQGEKSSTKVLRLKGQMQRVDEDGTQVWKLAGISEVPIVGAPAPNGQGQGQGQGQGSGK